MASAKEDLLKEFLRRQSGAPSTALSDSLLENDQIHVHPRSIGGGQLVPVNDSAPQEDMELFKQTVREWIKLDEEVKDLSAKIRMLDSERKTRRNRLDEFSKRIIAFMRNNEIDELNSRDGKIKSKTTYVKVSMSQKKLMERLRDEFQGVQNVDDKLRDVFQNRERVEKNRLLRTLK